MHYPTFRQILQTWSKFHSFLPKTEEEILAKPLWNNDSILIKKKTFTWTTWKAAGIECVNDILHPRESRFLAHEEITAEYGIPCSFLNVYQMRSALPCSWERLIHTAKRAQVHQRPVLLFQMLFLAVSDSSSKKIYEAILPFKRPIVSSQRKWTEIYQDMNSTLTPDLWKEIYTVPYHVTRDTKLQAFQYRLVHRIIPCNKYLTNIRIKNEASCSFCGDTDTLDHFFFTCQDVNGLWDSLTSWLANNVDLHIQLNAKRVLFGPPRSSEHALVINFLILFPKYYIYRQRLFHQNQLEILQILRELRL